MLPTQLIACNRGAMACGGQERSGLCDGVAHACMAEHGLMGLQLGVHTLPSACGLRWCADVRYTVVYVVQGCDVVHWCRLG
jgi:hypothetical protein